MFSGNWARDASMLGMRLTFLDLAMCGQIWCGVVPNWDELCEARACFHRLKPILDYLGFVSPEIEPFETNPLVFCQGAGTWLLKIGQYVTAEPRPTDEVLH